MMVFEHDYDKFPELTNKQLEQFRATSPHPQIEEDFSATVVRVHDGDTVTLSTSFRDFDFPMRFLEIDAKELNAGGEETREWLKERIEGKRVQIKINRQNRVDKYGRLLGKVVHNGIDVGEEMLRRGLVGPFERRDEGKLPDLNKLLRQNQWLTAT